MEVSKATKRRTPEDLLKRPNIIAVARDYTHDGFSTRFNNTLPQELREKNITETEFHNTVARVNEMFEDAEQLNCCTFTEGCFGFLTVYSMFLFYDNHYKRLEIRIIVSPHEQTL
ncbi:golgin subfamily A member 7-like [Planoprotostelium fungivorum]|uniref:Ras modification protein ERF4 n=1 Tax=Planoprotostelium fungivorum TaxID=1890364 RepID=A0A2P6MXF8_9EUKA|nr:golgin subfamily A member 7-like [Planoprotostelium fungivorum]